jgi:putative toxin-antitoxin system antitoxin component (TIGR02293 family)
MPDSASSANAISAVGDNKRGKKFSASKVYAFRDRLKQASLTERVRVEREGVPYDVVETLIDDLQVSATDMQQMLGIPKATFTKKRREKAAFAGVSGQSVVGLIDLIHKVTDMLKVESANPMAKDFPVEQWVGQWIRRPQPALGGLRPAQLMDTPSGRESVMRLLGSLQSGAYQ